MMMPTFANKHACSRYWLPFLLLTDGVDRQMLNHHIDPAANTVQSMPAPSNQKRYILKINTELLLLLNGHFA